MKNLIVFLVGLTVSSAVLAGTPLRHRHKSKAPASCGLPSGFDADTFEDVGRPKGFDSKTLTGIEKDQVVRLARFAVESTGSDAAITNFKQAAQYLLENAEAGDGWVGVQKASGTDYSVAVFWPGGISVGLVFEKGTANIIGTIHDTEVKCAQ